jgi:integrase
MQGVVRQRRKGGLYEYILELGKQPAQRCTECSKRYWVDRKRLEKCPKCGGKLTDTEERRQKSLGGFRTKKEAQEALDKAKVAVAESRYVVTSNVTLRTFLEDEWLPTIKQTVRPSTYASYEGHVRNHLIPRLGSIQLRRLNAGTLNAHYAHLLAGGRVKGKSSLKPATVRRVHATLRRALHDAVRWQRLHHNPTQAADPPKASAEHNELPVWTKEELKKFLKSVRRDELYALWLMYTTTGMRRGEALGLQWSDVDLVGMSLSIQRSLVLVRGVRKESQPKTSRGRRTVALDPATVAALKAHRKKQAALKMKHRKVWQDGDWVFTTRKGTPLDGNKVYRRFIELSKAAELPKVRLHSLRHAYATVALGGGMNARDLSARLGHATVAFTLDVYSHAIPAVEEEAAVKVAALFVP